VKKEKTLTRDELIGMEIVDGEGYIVGKVQDVAFTPGKPDLTMIVKTKKGESEQVAWDRVQAVGDFILLKPKEEAVKVKEEAAAAPQSCPTCGGALTYIDQYKRWYCYKCKKYV